MFTAPLKSFILVTLQFTLIGVLLFTTAPFAVSVASTVLIAASVLLVIWAIAVMQQSKFRISPVPAAAAVLVTSGPYRFIRHPMYTAILLGAAGLLTGYFSWIRLSMAVLLAIVLIIKLFWEEKMLTEKFSTYGAYKKNSRRLFPYIF
ncbi:MAG: isoprenylcysteine carboxylmethyltransferase family protein [Ferruginibacter sp.]